MKKTFIVCLIVVGSIGLTVGVVKAASAVYDTLTVGRQGVGGVTYFNGTMKNSTTGTGGADNPVTIGDNLRVDGRVYRGATAGTTDSLPFLVNDNMEVAGTLTVTKGIAYNNSASGLTSTTVQAAIDELGVKLSNAISGHSLTAAGGMYRSAVEAPATTTWNGTASGFWVDKNGDPCTFQTSKTIAVTFTPTTETSGTFTAAPYFPFKPFYGLVGGACTATVIGDWEKTSFTGSYWISGNNLFALSSITDSGVTTQYQAIGTVDLRGDTMVISGSGQGQPVVTLTRI